MNCTSPINRAGGFACLLTTCTLVMFTPVFADVRSPVSEPSKSVAGAQEMDLTGAIERALAISPRTRAAKQSVATAEGYRRQAKLRPNPVLSFEAEDLAGSGAYRALDGAVYTLSVAQELEMGDQRLQRHAAASAEVILAQTQQQNAQLQLIMEVRSAYMRVIAAQEKLQLAREHQQVAQALLEEVQNRVRAGREPELYLSKAQINAARARLQYNEQQREVQHARHVLASFWFDRHPPIDYDAAPFFTLEPPEAEATLEAELRQHPYLRRWLAEQRKQQTLISLRRAEAMPNPSISLGVKQFEATSDQALVVGLSVPLPIFDRNQGKLQSAHAELAKSTSEQQVAELELTAQGLQALEDMTNAYHRAQILANGIIPAAASAFALADEGFEAGRFSYLDVLDAQQALFDAKQERISALEQYQLAWAEVKYVMASDASYLARTTLGEQ